jgi:putative transposase
MPHPIAEDVRAQVIEAVTAGASAREAARRLGVSVSSAIKWAQRWRRSGSYAATTGRICTRSPLQAETEWLLALARDQPGITLAAVQRRLRDRDISVALSSIWRFYDRHGIRLRRYRGVTQ